MSFAPIFTKSGSKGPQYTNLFACVSEEEDSYTVQVRLYNRFRPESTAWEEEATSSSHRMPRFNTLCGISVKNNQAAASC
jgi:hypothetical protein